MKKDMSKSGKCYLIRFRMIFVEFGLKLGFITVKEYVCNLNHAKLSSFCSFYSSCQYLVNYEVDDHQTFINQLVLQKFPNQYLDENLNQPRVLIHLCCISSRDCCASRLVPFVCVDLRFSFNLSFLVHIKPPASFPCPQHR